LISPPKSKYIINSWPSNDQFYIIDVMKEAKVVSVINQKGGVGKTTLCYHLAHALSNLNKKVLCIDFDPQANLSYLFGRLAGDDENNDEIDYSLFQLLINSIKELKHLHQGIFFNEIVSSVNKNIDLLPTSQDLSGFDLTVAGINFPRQLILKKFFELNDIKKHYDYILIDAPPTLGLLVINILCACDKLVIPIKADDFSFQGVKQFHKVLESIDEMGIVKTPIISCYVPNLVDLRRKKEEMALNKFKEEYKEKVLKSISSSAVFVKAQAEKKSIFDYHSKDYTKWQNQFTEIANCIL